jgi:hypothetical protein
MDYMTKAEVDTLWDWQRRAGARSVKFAVWPTQMGLNPDYDACSANDLPMKFTEAMPLGVSGVKRDAPLSTGGIWG